MDFNLADQQCLACSSDDEPLPPEVYLDYLKQLDTEKWNVIEYHHLHGVYTFPDFKSALSFSNSVGLLAEEEWHHPDIHLSWGKLKIDVWTHKINGLHKTDFVFAAKVDRMYAELSEN